MAASSGHRPTWLAILRNYWRYIVIVLVPILLLPVLENIGGAKAKCGYMMAVMAVYWVCEVIPLGATGLIPIFLAPLFGLLTSTQVAANYMKEVTVMMSGGLLVAIAVERSNLHRRLALSILRLMGTRPKWLMLGFMLPTFILSMFISNTATTAMMLPIMEAVLQQLRDTPGGLEDPEEGEPRRNGVVNPALESDEITNDEKPSGYGTNTELHDVTANGDHSAVDLSKDRTEGEKKEESPYFKRIAKGMTLAVCYSANVGGTATLTGTNPNLILKGVADDIWAEHGESESPVYYSSWFPWGLPSAIMNFCLIYAWLLLFYVGWRAFICKRKDPDEDTQANAVRDVINCQYKQLGPITFAEVAVSILFAILVLLWLFRNPGFMDGWAIYFEEGFVRDSVPAMLIATACFCCPMVIPNPWQEQPDAPAPALLIWQDVHDKFPWSIIFLMGGGFSLAQAAEVSGLSEWIGDQLTSFGDLPSWLMIALICFLVAMLTEVTSNSATCTILMPIMSSMAEKLGRNPLFLMLPTAVSTSYAFMLPVATPPNAIAFSYGRLSVLDMIKGGAILNLLCVFSVTLGTVTWGTALFDLDKIPWDDEVTTTALNDFVSNITTEAIPVG